MKTNETELTTDIVEGYCPDCHEQLLTSNRVNDVYKCPTCHEKLHEWDLIQADGTY